MKSGTAAPRHITQLEWAECVYRTELARESCQSALHRAMKLMESSRDLSVIDPAWPRFFVVHGSIEDRHVRATWFRGALMATRILRERAQILVALGETFSIHEDAPVIEAGLLEPLPAMLTMIRSCDRLEEASFGPLAVVPTPRRRASSP